MSDLPVYQPYNAFDSRQWWTKAEKEIFEKVNTEILHGSVDAIVWIEGDHDDRVKRCVELFEMFEKRVPIILSGGVKGNPYRPDADTNPDGGNIPAWEIKEYFLRAGVPEDMLILESESLNAKDQSVNVIKMVKEKKWKRIILVASLWHQPRLFLTFVKQLHLQSALDIELINQPETRFSLDRIIPGRGKNIIQMIPEELWRITNYIANGSTATAEEGLAYLARWKKEYGEVSEEMRLIEEEIRN